MKTAEEILDELTGEDRPHREEIFRAMRTYAEQAIDRCAEEADNIQNIYFAKKLRKIKSELK